MSKSSKLKNPIIRWALLAGVPLVLVAAGVSVGLLFLLPSEKEDAGPTLFVIQRSKNANEVHYDVQVNSNGELDDEPVKAYWVLKAEDGGREDLSYFEEEMAYGFEVSDPDSNGDREMKLVAWEDRTITLTRTEEGNWRAVTTIDGEEAYLERLYIETDEGGVTPTVLYVDLFGKTVDGGDDVKERVKND